MTPGTQMADLLIVHGTLITVDPERRVIEDGALAVRGDRIVAIGASADLERRFVAGKTLNAHRKAVLPGLIDGVAAAVKLAESLLALGLAKHRPGGPAANTTRRKK